MNRVLLLSTVLMLGAGCATRTAPSTQQANSIAPALSVERFLQAVNERDLEAMASLFGTADGPVRERRGRWEEVELQMDIIQKILVHNDYEIVSETMVAGRRENVTRIGVDLSLPSGVDVRDVGFDVVEASGGRWLVERIDLEKVTSAI